MFRIWSKVLTEEHIERQFVYEKDTKFAYSRFFDYLAEICTALDVPTPVLLKTHVFNFAKFNHVVFRPSDFMEAVSFDKFVLENIM